MLPKILIFYLKLQFYKEKLIPYCIKFNNSFFRYFFYIIKGLFNFSVFYINIFFKYIYLILYYYFYYFK